jgi:serine/threonine protein phosphatase PrpC
MSVSTDDVELGGISHIGPVREENQDSICWVEDIANRGASLFAVADGMGGYNHGKLASSMALEKILDAFTVPHVSPLKQLKRGIEAANLAIYQATQRMGAGRMGTTLTAAYLEGNHLMIGHVGDSRAYLLRGQQVSCLTRDHTVVGDMVRMRVLSPDKIRTHAQRSVLTRGLGLNPFVTADISQHTVKEGDTLILCSDGFWSVIEDEELPVLNQTTSDLSGLLSKLIMLAIERGTDDNISVVSVRIHSLNSALAKQKQGGWQWLRFNGRPS